MINHSWLCCFTDRPTKNAQQSRALNRKDKRAPYLTAQQAGAPTVQAAVPACAQFSIIGHAEVPFIEQSPPVGAGLVKLNSVLPDRSAAAPNIIILIFIAILGYESSLIRQ